MTERTYKNDESWRVIQCYLPKHNRIHETNQPTEEWISLDNYKIHVDSHTVKDPKGVVVVFHGLGGNGRISSAIALPVCENGYDVICPDLPQFGLSEGSGTAKYSDWLNCGVEVCKKYHKKDLPFYLFGISASGLLVYQIACRLDFVNAIASTCILDLRDPRVVKGTVHSSLMAYVGKPLFGLLHNCLGDKKIPVTKIVKMKRVVNNDELAEIMMNDPLSAGTRISIEFINGLFNPVVDIEPEDFDKCPVLIVHPELDRFCDPSLSRLFYERLKCEKKMVSLKTCGHFMIEKEGLLILEKEVLDFYETYK